MDPFPVFQLKGSHRPMTNAERQREFRKRHPGYNKRYKARIRAQVKALQEARLAPAPAPALVLTLARPEPLMLPAPVEAILIPGMNTIGPIRQRELVDVAA